MFEEYPGGQCGRCEVRKGEKRRRLEATEERAGSGARWSRLLKTIVRNTQVSPRLNFVVRDGSCPVFSVCRPWAPLCCKEHLWLDLSPWMR